MKKFTDFSWKKGGLWIVSSLVGAMAIIGLFLFTFFDSPKAFLQFLHDYQIIRSRYFRPVSDETLFQGAVKGMASSLGDTYSVYLTGDVYKSFMEQTTAAFGGVGIIIGEDKQEIFTSLQYLKRVLPMMQEFSREGSWLPSMERSCMAWNQCWRLTWFVVKWELQ